MAATAGATEAYALLVVPEPTDWLGPMLAALQHAGRVEVFAPWVLPPAVLSEIGSSVGYVRRRNRAALPSARNAPWFTAAELVARAWARGRTARTLANRTRLRALADFAAAAAIHRRARAPELVVAPSLAARRTFAAAAQVGATTLLIEDLPDFDTLVDGLDALARQHPQAHFLRNHRPSARAHARQRAERWQADAIAVRGRVAWHRVGAGTVRVELPCASPPPSPASSGRDVLFAGPPLARSGSVYLPALLEALPHRTVRVLPGPCSEPTGLLQHPRLRVHRSDDVEGIGVVLSLSPLESTPAPVARALAAGIPVVGTSASTGILSPTSVVIVEPSDPIAVAGAIEAALETGAPLPVPWSAPTTLRDWLSTRPPRASPTPPRRSSARRSERR